MASIIKANQLQDFGGNSILTSDGAGNLTTQKINYPAFEVELTSDQAISDGTVTTIQFNSTLIDTGSFWDSTNYRWLPTVAGKYYVYAQANLGSDAVDSVLATILRLDKNGSRLRASQNDNQNNDLTTQEHTLTTIVELNGTSDYISVAGYIDVNTGTPTIGANDKTRFGAYRIGS